ncbi:response regulator transcription factor [Ornithinibacillus sp. 179-J 7C1 HS]|uniref:response regulator transcription factor n=1 Tax=Ornithinibacillus sp. 179-J 7C1 HS TaxID=3142384 RepID=UPI0039A0134E
MINVFISDRQRLFIEGIQSLLEKEKDFKVVGTSCNGRNIPEKIINYNPHVILMDINLVKDQMLVEIKKLYTEVKIVILVDNINEEKIYQCLLDGADGFVLKKIYSDTLFNVIKDTIRGQYVLSGDIARLLVKKVQSLMFDDKLILKKELEKREINFTERELEIAILFMKGYSNKQIMKKVHLSEGTVKNYISEIYMKIGIHQRAEAIKFLSEMV